MTSATVDVYAKFHGNTKEGGIVVFWGAFVKEKFELSLKG